ATVGRVVPGRSTLPVLTNVLSDADHGDGLRLVATNLDLTVSRRIRATVSSAGRTTVPARLLADYVALLDRGKQVSLNLTSSGHKLHLACDRYEANISMCHLARILSQILIEFCRTCAFSERC